MTRLFDSALEPKSASTEPNYVAGFSDALSSQAIALLKSELSTVKANAIKESKEATRDDTRVLSPKDSKVADAATKDTDGVKEAKWKSVEGTKDIDAIKELKPKDLTLIKHIDEPTSVISPFSELRRKHSIALAIETPLTALLARDSFLFRNSSPLASRALMLGALFVGADVLYRTAGTMQGLKVGSVYGDTFKDVAKDFGSLIGWKSK